MPPAPSSEPFPPLVPVVAADEPGKVESEVGTQSRWTSDQVGAWMQQPVVTCLLEQTLDELLELLSLHRISGLPVVDERGNLLGMVSQSDVAAFLTGQPWRPDTTVAQLYSPTVHSVEPEAKLREVVARMLREHVHRLPVVRSGKLVGLVSTLDVLRVLRDQRLL